MSIHANANERLNNPPASFDALGESGHSALQLVANATAHVQQLKSTQAAANASPMVRQLKALQLAANPALAQTQPVQRKAPGSGSALPEQLQMGIEELSGVSMEGVKVHHNSDRPADVGAHAYAQGSDIHLAQGQEQHLAHEAWHVAQQRQGRVRATTQIAESAVNDSPSLEHEADAMGAKAMQLKAGGKEGAVQLKAGGDREGMTGGGAGGDVVQRMPAEFNFHAVFDIEGKGFIFKNWKHIQAAVRAYSFLDALNTHGRKTQLPVIQSAIETWRIDNKIYTTAFNDLTQDQQDKELALRGLVNDIQQEWVELFPNLDVEEETLGNLVVPGGQQVEKDPLPSRRVDGKETWGFFKAGARLYKADESTIEDPTEGEMCKLIDDETAPTGKNHKEYFKVKESNSSELIGTKALLNTGSFFNKFDVWVKRSDVIRASFVKPQTSVSYQEAYSPEAHPLFPQAPSMRDVEQNGLGDCYLLAAVMAIVKSDPAHFPNIMKDNLDGTVTVRLYDVDGNNFTPKLVTVKKSYPKYNRDGDDAYAGSSALWVAMLEKAYAAAKFNGRTSDTLDIHTTSYGIIEAGTPNLAMEHILGRKASKNDIVVPSHVRRDLRDWVRFVGTNGLTLNGDQIVAVEDHIKHYIRQQLDDLFKNTPAPTAKEFDRLLANVPQPANQNVAADMQTMVNWLKANVFISKRGSGVYAPWHMDIFAEVKGQVDAGNPITISTKEKVVSDDNQGGVNGENTGKGLSGPHAYAVLDYRPHLGPQQQPLPNQLFWLKLRNPWGEISERNPGSTLPGRKYRDKHTNETLDQPFDQPRMHGNELNKMGAIPTESPEFWIEFSDVMKRFSHYDF